MGGTKIRKRYKKKACQKEGESLFNKKKGEKITLRGRTPVPGQETCKSKIRSITKKTASGIDCRR